MPLSLYCDDIMHFRGTYFIFRNTQSHGILSKSLTWNSNTLRAFVAIQTATRNSNIQDDAVATGQTLCSVTGLHASSQNNVTAH
jgi:hypothetical protein